MKTKPLTPAQIDVIKRLKAGYALHYVDGINAYAFWGKTGTNANANTLWALSQRGLIAREGPFGKYRFVLTDAGRAVAEELEDGSF